MKKAPDRVKKIRELASIVLDEAESLDHVHLTAERSAVIEHLDVKSGINLSNEVRLFEMRLISRALELTGGNQARAGRMLGLGMTTLNHKVKSYKIL